MFSTTLRNWAKHNKDFSTSLILKTKTPVASFKFTKIEAKTHTQLEPIEWLILKSADAFEKITRVEIHAISGFQLHVINEVLQKLEDSGLLNIVDFDRTALEKNLERLENEFGEDWKSPELQKILNRPELVQYSISDTGRKAMNQNLKVLEEIIDLNVFVTAYPFKLFFGELNVKPQSFEELDVTADVANRVLHLAKLEGKKLENGIIPLAVTNETAITGIEVPASDFWVLVNLPEGEKTKLHNEVPFLVFLTSVALIKWINPTISESLNQFVEIDTTAKKLVSESLSNKYQIVEELIEEGLALNNETGIWTLVADLEMFKLIRDVEKSPIEQLVAEIELKMKEPWSLLIQLRLEPMEELDETALFVARFHSRVKRSGFTEDEGYDEWTKILEEAGRKPNRKGYKKALQILTKNKCLKIQEPKIKTIVVDLDFLLSFEQRSRDIWKFNRIQQFEELAKRAKIKKIYYYASDDIFAKIDNEDEFQVWKDQVDLVITDDRIEALRFAVDKQFHFIGLDEEEEDNLEIDQKKLGKLKVAKKIIWMKGGKKLEIPDFEPIYHWLPENILDKLYEEYYAD